MEACFLYGNFCLLAEMKWYAMMIVTEVQKLSGDLLQKK